MDGLGGLGGRDRINIFRSGQGDQSSPGPHAGLGCQVGCAHVIPRPSNYKYVAKGAFVGVKRSLRQVFRHPTPFQRFKLDIRFFFEAGRNADVQHPHVSGVLSAGKIQQSHLGIAQGEGHVTRNSQLVNLARVCIQSGGEV